jgi:hypothetical protein
VVVLAGFGLDSLSRRIDSRRVRVCVGALVLTLGIVPMFHRVWWVSAHSYTFEMRVPRPWPVAGDGFFQVQSRDLPIWRAGPPESLAHVNLARGVGAID